MEWIQLYNEAKKMINNRRISLFIEAGAVAAALETKDGNIYVGVNIDSSCSLGMCAERNAMANMITHGEHSIKKIICVRKNGEVWVPCGSCREFMMELDLENKETEILVDINKMEVVKLKDLLPNWWGEKKIIEKALLNKGK